MIPIPYAPHPNQLKIHQDNHRFQVVVCGRRFGKTVFLVNKIIKEAAQSKGEYWYLAPTYRQAKLVAWAKFKEYCVPELLLGSPNESELKLTLINGSIIRLMGADNEDSLRGSGLQGIGIDEAQAIKDSVWPQIIRPMLADTKGWATFIGTPAGKTHFYELFIKDEEFYDDKHRTIDNMIVSVDVRYKSFRFFTKDNPYIDPQEIEDARLDTNEEFFRQEYEASFENYAGVIYKEYRDAHNIITPEIGKTWNIYVGLDTGRYTGISFVCIDTEDKAYVFDEIYDHDGIVTDICDMIFEKLEKHKIDKTRVMFIIDSASQVKREFQKRGIMCFDSEKHVDNSINIIRNRLKTQSLFFDTSCVAHISEHRGYVWDDNIRSRLHKAVPKKENDHTVNSLQYVLNHTATYKTVEEENVTIEELEKMQPDNPDFERFEDELAVSWTGQKPHESSMSDMDFSGQQPMTEYDKDEYKKNASKVTGY